MSGLGALADGAAQADYISSKHVGIIGEPESATKCDSADRPDVTASASPASRSDPYYRVRGHR